MGIQGLLSMIKSKADPTFKDIVGEAKRKGGIEILVDFNAIVRFLDESILRKIADDSDNKYLQFPLVDYDLYSNAICDFHKAFADCNIKLVWFPDGPKGVDETNSEEKFRVWVERNKQDEERFVEILESCRTKDGLKNLHSLGPLMRFDVTIEALKRAGAEVIPLLQGEADDFIAYEFKRRNSYAILTNDTDFVIFDGCRVIFDQLLSFKYGGDNMKLPFIDTERNGKIFETPNELIVPIIEQRHVLQLFEFYDPTQMIVLSIIKGNDNTKKYAQQLQYSLKITKQQNKVAHVTHVANFIKRNGITIDNIFNNADLQKFVRKYSELEKSIQYCKQFYSLERIKDKLQKQLVVFDENVSDSSLKSFLSKKLNECEISKVICSIHSGKWFDCVVAEKPSKDCPPIFDLLHEIRMQIYPYLLDDDCDSVIEWRGRLGNEYKEFAVSPSNRKTNQINGNKDGSSGDEEVSGMKLFERIWSQSEAGHLGYVEKFGLEVGVLCYILRYFYRITNGINLNVTIDEFKSLFVATFYQFEKSRQTTFAKDLARETFLGLQICPTEKCFIIANWFLCIFHTAKYVVGGALNLTEFIPGINQFMAGSIFYAFYENALSKTNKRTDHLEESIVASLTDLSSEVLGMFEVQFENVIQN